MSYQNVADNVNLTYQIKNKELQNSIIVGKAQAEYSYTFTLQSSNLQFMQNVGGSITAKTESGKAKFLLAKPYMTDAKGAYSNAVTYTLQENDGTTELTVTADSEWLNEQASFPVSITPTLESIYRDNFDFANVFKNGATVSESNYAYAGTKNGEGNSDLFLNFRLPEVDSYYQLVGATVAFDYQTHTKGLLQKNNTSYNVYLAESKTSLGAITYDEKPQKIENLNPISKYSLSDGQTLTYESGMINVNNIKDGVLTLGIEQKLLKTKQEEIKAEEDESVEVMSMSDSITIEQPTEDDYVAIPMSLSDSVETTYFYQVASGIKDSYSMETFEIEGMTAYVNSSTGRLTATMDLVSVNTFSDMPFVASLVYNDSYGEIANDLGLPLSTGNNFKLNFQQYMVLDNGIYYLIDADGSVSAFHALTSGLYYSKDKKLYYNSTTGVAYDTLGNEMLFEDGLLREIRTQNNPTEFIRLGYFEATDQILYLYYYVNSTAKYTINFAYTDDKITLVSTNVGEKCALAYDESENLISIKNQTGFSGIDATQGVQTLTLIYRERAAGILDYVYNHQKNGLNFERTSENIIYEVLNMNIESVWNIRYSTSTEFLYCGAYTEIYYKENGIIKTTKDVAFNNAKEMISEWSQNSQGIVSVYTTTTWVTKAAMEPYNYNQTKGSYYHKSLPVNGFSINAYGAYEDSQDDLDLNVENHDNYQFAIVFKVYFENNINTGFDLGVKIGNEPEQRITLTDGGRTYVCVSCGYYDSTMNLTIRNYGDRDISIAYLTYTVIDSVTEAYTYDSSIKAHKLATTTNNMRSGECVENTYDNKQRIEKTEKKDIDSGKKIETTTYVYYDDATDSVFEKGKLKETVTSETTNEQTEQTEKTEYSYDKEANNYTETCTVTKGTLKTQNSVHKLVSELNGIESVTITQTDENNQTATAYYTEISGNIRLEKIEYNDARETYTYNNLGQITNVSVYDATANTLLYSQTDNYDANGAYIGSTYAGTQYTYGYDETGYVTSISENGTNKLTYEYHLDSLGYLESNRLERKTYANGDVEEYTYTSNNNSTAYQTQVVHKKVAEEVTENGTYIYNYNENMGMTSQEYRVNGSKKISYDYGDLSDLDQQTLEIGGLQYHFEYTVNNDRLNNRVKNAKIYSLIGCSTTQTMSLSYQYNADDQLSRFTYSDYEANYGYDDLGRLTSKTSETYYTDVQKENYVYETYTKDGTVYETNRLLRIDDQTYEDDDRTSVYDGNGNVTSGSYNGHLYGYEYDKLGRLTKETKDGTTVAQYSYDQYNNVQKTGSSWTYTNGKLTAVGNKRIIYDEMGNPTTYKGNTFEWQQGRKLVSGTLNNKDFAYSYDGNGMRYKKVVDNVPTEYYYNGSQLLMENRNGNRIYYIYGVTGIEGMVSGE